MTATTAREALMETLAGMPAWPHITPSYSGLIIRNAGATVTIMVEFTPEGNLRKGKRSGVVRGPWEITYSGDQIMAWLNA